MMENIVKGMMELSLLCSGMILAVLLLKTLWGKKMHQKVVSILWLMVLVRLLLPVTLDTPFHLDQLSIPASKETGAVPPAKDPIDYTPSHQPNGKSMAFDSPSTESNASLIKNKAPDKEGRPHLDFTVIIYPMVLMLWLLGVGVVLLVGSVKTMIFYFKVSRCVGTKDHRLLAMLQKNKVLLRLNKSVKIITSPYLSSPIAFGVLRPTIFIPNHYLISMDEDKLRLMLMHELGHIKRKDMLNYLWFIARTIHWFNPLVWLAYQSYRDDVELSCDQMVLKTLRREEPAVYCQSLLDVMRYAKYSLHAPAVLSFYESTSNLKRRIETMMKPHKNHKAVTAIAMLFAVMMVVGCFTTACQPTPEKAVVDNKIKSIDSVIKDNKEATTPEPSDAQTLIKGFMATYETPDTVTGTYAFPNIHITMDAEVIVPETDKIASIVYTPKELTQERADAFRKYFVGDAELYERITNEDTKSELEPDLTFWQEELFKCETNWEEMKKRDYYRSENYTKSEAVAHLKDKIKDIKRQISKAPSKVEYNPTSGEVINDPEAPGNQRLFAYAKVPGGNRDSMAQLMISGRPGRCGSYIYENCVEARNSTKSHEELEKEMQLTLDDAVSIAKKTICEMGGGDVYLDYSGIGQCIKNQKYVPYYSLGFAQSVSGLPVKGYCNMLGEPTLDYAPRLQSESFIIHVDDEGVVECFWEGMKDVVEVLDKDVHILGFDEVMNIFKEKIGLHISAQNQTEVVISKVSLNCLILPVKDNLGKGVTVPVWHFRGYHYENAEQKEKYEGLNIDHWSYLTINAVDGSIIS